MRVRAFAAVIVVGLSVNGLKGGHQSKTDRAANHSAAAQTPATASARVPINKPDAERDHSNTNTQAGQADRLMATFLEKLVDPVTWFTLLLLIVSALQWCAMRRQSELMRRSLVATRRSNHIARSASEVADRSLRLLNKPWLDTDGWTVREIRGPDPQEGWEGPLESLRIEFNIVNPSNTPATIYRVSVTDIGSGSPAKDWTVESDIGNLITPGGRHPHAAEILAEDLVARQISDYEKGRGVVIEIRGVVYFTDLFDNERTPQKWRERHFGRNCILKRNASEFLPVAGAELIDPEQNERDT
jgi:hypothetical protein